MASLTFGDRAGRSFWRLVPKRSLSGVIGWWARRPLAEDTDRRSRSLEKFAARYGIDVTEAEKPLAAYRDYDEFFTRRLREGARPIDRSPGVVVNPADGVVVESGVASDGKLIQAKGVFFSLSDLLMDDAAAKRLTGGAYLITYLSPRDYHRVHAPAAGHVTDWLHVAGTLFSVNARSVVREPGLFARNERVVMLMDGEAGRCAVVMVAAVGVGHVTAAFDPEVRTHANGAPAGGLRRKALDPPPALERGGELGTFHLGSTTIVIFEPGRVVLDALAPGSATRMGARIGSRAA